MAFTNPTWLGQVVNRVREFPGITDLKRRRVGRLCHGRRA
jgi:hypothetical protein